ncbi:synaptogenesis protein syg-2-like isoform X2 [Acanthaster planci]|uniref:Synaptogenesis protein syg-2-like isoform X2 n=1 Tax=Acanthaster planci TaxID=133434 RepID=A0A8B8A6E4_ACAPL|nr:synaptogenesis protein syg-2-like isoform X2 [Acanthaster planci]
MRSLVISMVHHMKTQVPVYIYSLMSVLMYISGQQLTVTADSSVAVISGGSANLTCTYEVQGTSLVSLEWRKGATFASGTRVVRFLRPNFDAVYGPVYGPPVYTAYRDGTNSSGILTLQISPVVYKPNETEIYWCRVVVTGGVIVKESSTSLIIIVVPTTITLFDTSAHYPNTGGKAVLVEGKDRLFTCHVPYIKPAASFTWTVGGGTSSITPRSPEVVNGTDGLFNSTSVATLSPRWNPHEQVLMCQASNLDNHLGLSVNVTLDVKVPPKNSTMSLSKPSGAFSPGGTASVDQDACHVFTCQAQSRPAATIQWDLGSNSYQQSTISPATGGPGDGLVYTTSMWTFTPGRDNHRQQVKCEANTTESQPPYPSVMVTLDVNGPPNTPVITGSQQAVENTPTSLICRADMGYPETWNLTWSYGDLSVTGLTTNSAHNNRFNFSTTLAISSRIFNGKVINCTAERGSWKSGVGQTSGAVSVKFCARNISVSCPADVTAGNEVSLTCLTSESSNPATTLTWYNNSESVTSPIDQEESPGAFGGKTSESTYRINVLTKYHNQNQFRCCANNSAELSCAEDLCHACTLNVKYAPEFTSLTQSPNNPVTEGSNVILTCTVDANPMPGDITWEKQGSNRAYNSEYNAGTSTLTLSSITRERSGYYTCKANNEIPTGNPAHMVNDVVSSPLTVIVHYEVNITNKGMTEQGGKDGGSASLTCIAKGNPRPTMQWYGLNNTVITSETDTAKFMVVNVTTGGDGVYGFQVTSTLTINNIDSDIDFGTYTCISTNGIGEEDMLKVNLTGTRRPDKPIRVMITGQTAESLTVTWTAGYDGGEEQSFRVSYLKVSDSTETGVGESVTGGKTTYTVTGLEDNTEYEIRVYARNAIGENTDYAKVVGHTLPKPPGSDAGITVEYNTDDGTVKVTGLKIENSCIQLEVKYEGNDTWQECGKCIDSDQTVTLSEWCAVSQTRRRRAVGDIEDVRAKLCIGGLCSKAAPAEQVKNPPPVTSPDNRGIIVGAVVGGVVLLAIIIALATYLVRMSPADQKSRRKKTTGTRTL